VEEATATEVDDEQERVERTVRKKEQVVVGCCVFVGEMSA